MVGPFYFSKTMLAGQCCSDIFSVLLIYTTRYPVRLPALLHPLVKFVKTVFFFIFFGFCIWTRRYLGLKGMRELPWQPDLESVAFSYLKIYVDLVNKKTSSIPPYLKIILSMAEALLGRSKISKDDLIILNLILSLSASDLPSRNISKYSSILVLHILT